MTNKPPKIKRKHVTLGLLSNKEVFIIPKDKVAIFYHEHPELKGKKLGLKELPIVLKFLKKFK
jgi:hypothetical protein